MSAEREEERAKESIQQDESAASSEPPRAAAAGSDEPVSAAAADTDAPTDDGDDDAPTSDGDDDDDADEPASDDAVWLRGVTPSLGERVLRAAYWGGWFVLAPAAFAACVLYALSPNDYAAAGALGTLVREQPVPVAIVAFALAATALWAARFKLPLQKHAFVPLPAGASEAHRPMYERAQLLWLRGQELLKARGARVSASSLKAVQRGLRELSFALAAEPFDEPRLQRTTDRADELLSAHFGAFRKSELRETVEQYAVALIAALLLRALVFEAFRIPSSSMVPTVQTGDHLFVFKASYGPQIPGTSRRLWESMPPHRGDVMVFRYPVDREIDFIKRVIALPGDVLTVRGGHPIINGWEVPSCRLGRYAYTDSEESQMQREGELFVEFLGDESYLTFYDDAKDIGGLEMRGPYTVPEGEVYVMGDNRHNSQDSRFWWNGMGGGVPFDHIKGRASIIWLSVGGSGVDWARIGKRVMGAPVAPRGRADLQAQLDACMAQRPAVTTPPR